MKDEILNIFKEDITIKISFIFILLFPVVLLLGSAVLNLSIVIMNILFLIHVFNKKNFQIFKNDIFYLLLALWFFLIINTLLNQNFEENYSRSFGFIRFILLIFSFSYFLSYKNSQFKKIIFDIWTIVFIIVSLDLLFEFFFGFNTLGFKSGYDGRLSGFLGEELKIGHWYLCFSLIILANNLKETKQFYFLLFVSVIVSLLIGERANFIRLFIAVCLFLIITRKLSFKKLVALILIVVASLTLVLTTLSNVELNKKIDIFKYRFLGQFIDIAIEYNSIKDINNNNPYTPMYFNAYYLFKDNKLLGVGVGSYMKKSHEKFREQKIINGNRIIANTHPHQHHFEILATLGLPGYVFIFSFLFYFLNKSFQFYSKNKDSINLSSFLIILVFSIPLLPTGSFFTTFGATIFWLNFSLMNIGNFKNINH
ncbi:O-antigen ligase family protein [Candidatus Pelagibacter sp.]|nr:O-antigen ligase family protein [Candidatus Pelagibacter sp.]